MKLLMKKWRWILLIVLLIGGGTVGYYAFSIAHFANSISVAEPLNSANTDQSEEQVDIPTWDGVEPVHILLLGTDSRDTDSNGRSDSMIVATIDPVKKKTYLMSIMRDTYVNIPGHGYGRINAAYSYGGAGLAMETVGDLLGIPINDYVQIDFKGFKSLVDMVGGVDIDVEKDMKYTDSGDGHRYDIDLKKGLQRLDGTHALQYVRFRHDATSDFTRTERQRKFLTALADKLQSSASLIKLPGILNSTSPYIQTSLTPTNMLKLARLGLDIDVAKTEQIQVPPNNLLEGKTVRGASVLGVDPDRLRTFIKETLSSDNEDTHSDENSTYTPSSTTSSTADQSENEQAQ